MCGGHSPPKVLFLESTLSCSQRWCLWSQFVPVFLLCIKRSWFIIEFQKSSFGLITPKRLPAEPWRLWCHFLNIHLLNWGQAEKKRHRYVTDSEGNKQFQKGTTSAAWQPTVVYWNKRELKKRNLPDDFSLTPAEAIKYKMETETTFSFAFSSCFWW